MNENNLELYYEESLKYAKENNKKIIWLGMEPLDYIIDLLNYDEKDNFGEVFISISPQEILNIDKNSIKELENNIFLCYHGNTSKFVSNYLKKYHSIDTYSLKGGITRVIGREL